MFRHFSNAPTFQQYSEISAMFRYFSNTLRFQKCSEYINNVQTFDSVMHQSLPKQRRNLIKNKITKLLEQLSKYH